MSTSIIGGEFPRDAENRFPDDLRTAFLARARATGAQRNQIILAEGLLSTDVYLIVSGRVKVTLISRHGQEQILREMGPREIFGELSAIDHRPRSANVVAMEDMRLAHLSGDEFISFLAETPSAGLWVARQLSARVRDLTAKIFALATMPVSTRLQCELMHRIDPRRMGNPEIAKIEPFPTHAELAKTIGTHREAVTRELGLLTKEGIIQQVGRRMEILSTTRLEAMVMRYLA